MGRQRRRLATFLNSGTVSTGSRAPVELTTTSAATSRSSSVVPGPGDGVELGGEALGALGRAVGDHQLGDAGLAQVAGGQRRSSCRRRPPARVCRGDRRTRGRPARPPPTTRWTSPWRSRSRSAPAWPRRTRARGSGRAPRRWRRPVAGGVERVLELAEDLGLADHQRVERGGDPEDVADGVVARRGRRARRRRSAGGHAAALGQHAAHRGHRLLAVAGRRWRRRSRRGCRSRSASPRATPGARTRASSSASVSSSGTASFSRTATGAVRHEMPTTNSSAVTSVTRPAPGAGSRSPGRTARRRTRPAPSTRCGGRASRRPRRTAPARRRSAT